MSSIASRVAADVALRKRLTLVACILGSAIALLDSTVVNVALPTIQRDLGGGLAAQQWVVDAYLLTLGSLILIGGSLGDLYGERRIFALGAGVFRGRFAAVRIGSHDRSFDRGKGPSRCGRGSAHAERLGGDRGDLQGVRAGPAIGSRTAWAGSPQCRDRSREELIQLFSWRAIFLINLPFVAVCVVLILVAIPPAEPRREGARQIDALGGVLCALGLGGPVFALIEQPRRWGSPGVVVPIVAGVALLVCSSCTRHSAATRCCRSRSFAGATSRPATSRRSRS